MIEQRHTDPIQQEETLLNLQLSQYRKINYNLRRKLKQKDQKIWSLLEMIGETGKYSQFTPPQPKKKYTHQRDYSLKLSLSEHKKQKQNKIAQNQEQQNIFRDESAHSFNKDALRLKLPTVDNKSNPENGSQTVENGRKKLVKIALQKLKPLDRSEVKRRFLLRYKGQSQIDQ